MTDGSLRAPEAHQDNISQVRAAGPQLIAVCPDNENTHCSSAHNSLLALGSHPSEVFLPESPVIFLTFDRPVDARTLAPFIEIGCDDHPPTAVHSASSEEIAADALARELASFAKTENTMFIKANSPLPSRKSCEVQVKAGAPSAQGKDKTSFVQTFLNEKHFTVPPPFQIDGAYCQRGPDRACRTNDRWLIFLSAPPDPKSFDPRLFKIEPSLENPYIRPTHFGIEIYSNPKQIGRYQVTLPDSLTDIVGRSIAAGSTATFEVTREAATKKPRPGLGFQGMDERIITLDPFSAPVLPIFSNGLDRLKIRVHRVVTEDWPRFIKWRHSFWLPVTKRGVLPGTLIFEHDISIHRSDNETVTTPIDFTSYLADGHGRFIVMVISEPESKDPSLGAAIWVQVTKLGLTAAVGDKKMQVFVTRLTDGAPVKGAEVSLQPGSGVSGVTDEDGMVELALSYGPAAKSQLIQVRTADDMMLFPKTPMGSWDIGFKAAAAKTSDKNAIETMSSAIEDHRLKAKASVEFALKRGGPYLSGEQLDAEVVAENNDNSPLRDAQVLWHMQVFPAVFQPKNRADYFFGPWERWWDKDNLRMHGVSPPCRSSSAGVLLGNTDSMGRHGLNVRFASLSLPTPLSVKVSAAVSIPFENEAWGEVEKQERITLHPSALYIGLRTQQLLYKPRQTVDVDALAVNLDGAAVKEVAMTVRWTRVERKRVGCTDIETEFETRECKTISAATAVKCKFTPTKGGEYKIEGMLHDKKGRKNRTEIRVWVEGVPASPFTFGPREIATLVSPRREIKAGQTASLLVHSPLYPVEGFLTLDYPGRTARAMRFALTGSMTELFFKVPEGNSPILSAHVDMIGIRPKTPFGAFPSGVNAHPTHVVGELRFIVQQKDPGFAQDPWQLLKTGFNAPVEHLHSQETIAPDWRQDGGTPGYGGACFSFDESNGCGESDDVRITP